MFDLKLFTTILVTAVLSHYRGVNCEQSIIKNNYSVVEKYYIADKNENNVNKFENEKYKSIAGKKTGYHGDDYGRIKSGDYESVLSIVNFLKSKERDQAYDIPHCSIIRNRGSLPKNINGHEMDKLMKKIVLNLNRMMYNSNVCFRIEYDDSWVLKNEFDTNEAKLIDYKNKFVKTRDCFMTYVEFVPVYHKRITGDSEFDSHTMGHAFFSGEVHLNGGLKWRIPYLHKNNDEANKNLPISQRDYDLQNSLTHEIIHTFGVGHTKKGLMASFYDDTIKIFNYDFNKYETNVLQELHGKRTSLACEI